MTNKQFNKLSYLILKILDDISKIRKLKVSSDTYNELSKLDSFLVSIYIKEEKKHFLNTKFGDK